MASHSDIQMATQNIPSVSVRMAIAVIGILPILVAYPFFQKYFEKGITMGAVKG
jgi:putative aldouronate transport system permease protein